MRGCSEALWAELGARREKDHPEDALPIYRRMIEPTINRKSNDAYHEAVELLKKLQTLMDRLGQSDEFAQYLVAIRAAHKAK